MLRSQRDSHHQWSDHDSQDFVGISPDRLARNEAGARSAATMRLMSALPADPQHQDPLDPERILRELPERERENFLSQYREALDGARDPAGWKHLRRVLRLWSWMVVATNQPGYYEAREQALAGNRRGDAAGGLHPAATWRVTYRPRLEQPVLRQMPGLPDDAFDLLVRMLARICDDPYDRLFSLPTGKDPARAHG